MFLRIKKFKRKLLRHRLSSLALVVLLIFGLGAYLYHRWTAPQVTVIPANTIHQLPAQPMPNNGNKTPSVSTNNDNNGSAVDTHGQSVPTTASNKWTVSQSGLITVKQPTGGSSLKSGEAIIGSAGGGIGQVEYRLLDNQIGVISQGYISVVNGSFSATINFQSHSSSGRLDVFNTDSGGREINEVQVPVSF